MIIVQILMEYVLFYSYLIFTIVLKMREINIWKIMSKPN